MLIRRPGMGSDGKEWLQESGRREVAESLLGQSCDLQLLVTVSLSQSQREVVWAKSRIRAKPLSLGFQLGKSMISSWVGQQFPAGMANGFQLGWPMGSPSKESNGGGRVLSEYLFPGPHNSAPPPHTLPALEAQGWLGKGSGGSRETNGRCFLRTASINNTSLHWPFLSFPKTSSCARSCLNQKANTVPQVFLLL